jgi:multiple sugar transport system permease protein
VSTLIDDARPAGPAAPPTPPPQPVRKRKKLNLLPYVLVLPALIAELAIHIIPMLLGIWIAFLSLNQLSIRNWINADFVGFTNFINGLNPAGAIGAQFFNTLGRTVVYTVLVLAFSWIIGTAAAYFLNTNFRGRTFLRTLYLLPYALPVFVSTIAFAFMFNQRDGLINKVLVDDLGLFSERPFWLIGSNAFIVLVVASVWTTWPFAFLLQLAALQTVPEEVYEAASLDGANRWRQFVGITLPMIRPSNVVLLLLMFLSTFNQFTVPYVLFGVSAPPEAQLISPLIYQFSFGTWNFGLGGAVSVMLLLLLFVVSAVYIRLVMPKEKSPRA